MADDETTRVDMAWPNRAADEHLAWSPGDCDECNGGHTCHEGNGFSGHAAFCGKNPGRQTPRGPAMTTPSQADEGEAERAEKWTAELCRKCGTLNPGRRYPFKEPPEGICANCWDNGNGDEVVGSIETIEVVPASSSLTTQEQRIGELERAGAWLLRLKDGPRDEAYEREKPKAWEALRTALQIHKEGPS